MGKRDGWERKMNGVKKLLCNYIRYQNYPICLRGKASFSFLTLLRHKKFLTKKSGPA